MTELVPQLHCRATQIGETVERTLRAASHHLTLCHGDFHAGQILRDRNSLCVVDWDNAQNDSPGFDLGTFAAHALLAAVTSGRDVDATSQFVDEVFDEYRAARELSSAVAGGGRLRDLRTACHCDASVPAPLRGLARPHRAFDRVGRSAYGQPVRNTYNCAGHDREARIGGGERYQRGTKDWLAQPLSPARVAESILPVVRNHFQAHDVRLQSIEILGYKPGRRCAAQYTTMVDSHQATAQRVFVAKARKKGLDILAADLQRRLYNRVQQADLSLQVAEPLGAIAEWGLVAANATGRAVAQRF